MKEEKNEGLDILDIDKEYEKYDGSNSDTVFHGEPVDNQTAGVEPFKELQIPNIHRDVDPCEVRRERERRARARRAKRWYAFQTRLTALVLVVLVIMGIVFYQKEKKFDNSQYKLITEQVEKTESKIKETNENIETMKQDELELADELYFSVKDCIENLDKSEENVVIKKLWKQKFPDDDTFQDDRTQGGLTIYALLDNHIEIRSDKAVLDTLQSIDLAKISLSNEVKCYNMWVESYNFWVEAWNKSRFIVKKNGKLDTGKYQRVILDFGRLYIMDDSMTLGE